MSVSSPSLKQLWLFSLLSACLCGTQALAQEDAAASTEEEKPAVIDTREASFMPPPASLLKVETPVPEAAPTAMSDAKPVTQTNVNAPAKPAAEPKADLTTPPPFIAKKAAPEAKVMPVAVTSPPADTAPQLPPPAQMAPVALGTPVAQTALADVDPETLGLLGAGQGGLAASMWKDTDRGLVDRYMASLALPTASPTLNDLGRRLFLTTASAPQVFDKAAQPKRSLLAQRIEALMAMGASSEAWKLAGLADPKLVDEVTLRLVTEAALIGPDSKVVCDQVPKLMAAHAKTEESGEQWQKALLVCQVRSGDTKAAQLGVDVMREKNGHDAVFLSLIAKNVLADSKKLPRQLTPLKPLTLALLRQIGEPLPPELYGRAEAALVSELLMTHSTDEKARVELAERSGANALITAAQLAAVYKSVTFDPAAIAKANESTQDDALSRAMAFQALLNEQSPAKKISLAQRVVKGLPAATLAGTHAQLLAGLLDAVPVSAEQGDAAVFLARLFALAGKPDKAAAWQKLATESQKAELKAEMAAQWPLFVLSGLVPDGVYAQGLQAWLTSALGDEAAQDGNQVHEKRALCSKTLLLLSNAGFAVPEEAWRRVLEPQPSTRLYVPSPVLESRLALAASAGRQGEALLLSLVLAHDGLNDAPLATRMDILRALRQIGLTAEAQAYAREIFLSL